MHTHTCPCIRTQLDTGHSSVLAAGVQMNQVRQGGEDALWMAAFGASGADDVTSMAVSQASLAGGHSLLRPHLPCSVGRCDCAYLLKLLDAVSIKVGELQVICACSIRGDNGACPGNRLYQMQVTVGMAKRQAGCMSKP